VTRHHRRADLPPSSKAQPGWPRTAGDNDYKPTQPKLHGTIKFFDRSKSFGFIIPDDTDQREVFVHAKGFIALPEEPAKLDTLPVTYRIRPPRDGDKGPVAKDVELAQ